ncbi:MAG TPA: CarD family transcriptional regulator [Clostridiales bacterium]|nr:CarD family transcriptional regulator [Clostridiales bacterium]
MFEINDTIFYGGDGVCTITEISKKKCGTNTFLYYVLKPLYQNNSTIFVPVNNESLVSKMRNVLTKDEAYNIINALPIKYDIWTDNKNERLQTFKEILASGNPLDLIKLITTLYNHQKEQVLLGKRLNRSDEQQLKDAEKMLYDEFAVALEIQPDEVLPFITKHINATAQQ